MKGDIPTRATAAKFEIKSYPTRIESYQKYIANLTHLIKLHFAIGTLVLVKTNNK